MIEQKDVIAFFDERAGGWDAGMVRSDEKIGRILDNAKVTAGSRVLDIACGTGVLIGDYLRRNVESVTAVDISPEMIRIAREKFPQENVRFVCGDAETAPLGEGFDAIVIYNAFPHFPDPERLVARLAALLAPGGRLTVAHGRLARGHRRAPPRRGEPCLQRAHGGRSARGDLRAAPSRDGCYLDRRNVSGRGRKRIKAAPHNSARGVA